VSRSDDLRRLGDEMVNDLIERVELLKQICDYARKLLTDFESKRKEMHQRLYQVLQNDRQQRSEYVASLLQEFRKENARTREAWHEILRRLRQAWESGRSAS